MEIDIKKIDEELRGLEDPYIYLHELYKIITGTTNKLDKLSLLLKLTLFNKPASFKTDWTAVEDLVKKFFWIYQEIIKDIVSTLFSINDPEKYIDELSKIIFSVPYHFARTYIIEEYGLNKFNRLIENYGKKQKRKMKAKINSIAHEILNKIELDTNCSEDKKLALLYAKWTPYIATYKASLHEIKGMIDKCFYLLNKSKEKWEVYNNTPKLNMTHYIYELKKFDSVEKVIMCTLLRRIIETIFSLQIFNNKKSVKNKFVNRGLNSYYKFFKEENIDWEIKSIVIDKDNKNKYKYFISKIWRSKKYLIRNIYHTLLSNNIHQRWESLISFEYFDHIKDFSVINSYIKRKCDELNKISEFLYELYSSLKNHLVIFEKGELIIEVHNFNMSELSIDDKYFNFDNSYKYEKITDEEYKLITENNK